MLHYGAAVEGLKLFADVARRERVILQEIEYLAATAIGQCLVNEIVIFFS